MLQSQQLSVDTLRSIAKYRLIVVSFKDGNENEFFLKSEKIEIFKCLTKLMESYNVDNRSFRNLIFHSAH